MAVKKIERQVLLVALIGFLVRGFFILFGAKFYFGTPNFYESGDTSAWEDCFDNLYHLGTYTLDPAQPYGYFARMPGYTLFIGIFYTLFSHNWSKLYPIIAWIQVLMDTFAIAIIYRIGQKIFADKKIASILALLYAFYPFIIVWNPVVYSESTSIFLLLLGFYYYLSTGKKFNYSLSGLFLGLAVLFRPQILMLVPILIIALLYKNYKDKRPLLKGPVMLTLFFLLSYSPWPIRNYVNYHKIILTQDLRGFPNWNVDVLSFMQYTFALKAEWEPQFTDIITNQKVTWPKEAYLFPGDSLKLAHAVYLSQNCGSGFSEWRGYWKGEVNNDSCTQEIKKIFDELREEQVTKNPVNFMVWVPLQNLKKAIFKFSLYGNNTTAKKIASLLFLFRTLLIFMGWIGAYLMFKSKLPDKISVRVIIIYFAFLYLILCAGTSPQLRDIEMRYFLPADVLILIPAAFFVQAVWQKFLKNGRQPTQLETK